MIAPILVYTFFAFLVAYFGRNRKFGFWVYFLLSFIFTPLISFIIVLASAKRTLPATVPAGQSAETAQPV